MYHMYMYFLLPPPSYMLLGVKNELTLRDKAAIMVWGHSEKCLPLSYQIAVPFAHLVSTAFLKHVNNRQWSVAC